LATDQSPSVRVTFKTVAIVNHPLFRDHLLAELDAIAPPANQLP
jgi:hypothetical protein